MKGKLFASMLVLLVATGPVVGQTVRGEVEIAGRGASDDGTPNRVAEYRTNTSGPELRFSLTAPLDTLYLEISSTAREGNDQVHSLRVDLNRLVRSHTTFTKGVHRLEHDPLTNLRGTVKDVVATWSTDLEPGRRYGVDWNVLESRTDLQVPGAGWLVVSAELREQWRKGHQQSLAMSHCSSCHVRSQGRQVDEHVRQAGLSARATFGGWSVVGSAGKRDFRERGATPVRLYEKVEQPALRTPLFTDRMQYGLQNGVMQYDLVPTTEKTLSKIQVSNGNLGGFALSLSGVSSNLENTRTGNEVDYKGVGLNLARKVGRRGSLALRARTYSIDSTDYFVDTTEPKAVAGPYVGKTYRERYGYDPDFVRQSAVDRDVVEGQARFAYRLGAGSSIAATYDLRSLDRDHYLVGVDETRTLEQKLKLAYSLRPLKGLTLRAQATYADIDNPFMILDAACNPAAMQTTPVASPLVPGSTQYYQIHDGRVADLGSAPSQWAEVRLSGSYQVSPAALAAVTYRWWDGKNDTQDLTDWTRNLNAVTAMLTVMPAERVDVWGGVTYAKRTLETHICIPLMDG